MIDPIKYFKASIQCLAQCLIKFLGIFSNSYFTYKNIISPGYIFFGNGPPQTALPQT